MHSHQSSTLDAPLSTLVCSRQPSCAHQLICVLIDSRAFSSSRVHSHQLSCALYNSPANSFTLMHTLLSTATRSHHVIYALIDFRALSSTPMRSHRLLFTLTNSHAFSSTLMRSHQLQCVLIASRALSPTLMCSYSLSYAPKEFELSSTLVISQSRLTRVYHHNAMTVSNAHGLSVTCGQDFISLEG